MCRRGSKQGQPWKLTQAEAGINLIPDVMSLSPCCKHNRWDAHEHHCHLLDGSKPRLRDARRPRDGELGGHRRPWERVLELAASLSEKSSIPLRFISSRWGEVVPRSGSGRCR